MQARIDNLQVQVMRLVKTLDCKCAADADPWAVETRIQSAAKTLLTLAEKLPPQGTRVPDALQVALDKLRPANYPRIDGHHAVWYPSLHVLLTAWVARGSVAFQYLQLLSAQFESTLDMPPPIAAPTVRPPPQSPIVDLTGLEDPEPQAPLPAVKDLPVLNEGTHGPRDARNAPESAPPVLNGLLTWLNTVDDKQVGSLAQPFHLTMQLAVCEIPNFLHNSLRH